MSRQEFIQTLRRELRKLPPEEIADATAFYEEYFDDVQESLDTEELAEDAAQALILQTETRLTEALGSPRTIAAQIKSDYAARILEGESTASGEKVKAKHKISAIWWVIIGICSAPVSIPLAIGIGCTAFAVVIGALSVILGIYAGIIGGFLGGIAAAVCGCVFMTSSLSAGVMCLGIGLLAMAASAAAGLGACIGTRELIRALARLARSLAAKRRRNKIEKMRGGAGYEEVR